jgi:hypothetical protein
MGNNLTNEMTRMDDNTIRVVFSMDGDEMVCLYFEVSKRGWTNKPIMTNKFRCVDAKVIDPKIYEHFEPKDLVMMGQDLIEGWGN